MLRILILFLCALTVSAVEPPASDSQIEANLRERLAKSVIGKDGFVPKVKDGVVYWSGATAVPQHKGAATRMAKSAGARRVVNNIRVSGAKPKETAAPPVSAAPAQVNKPSAKSSTAASKAEPAPEAPLKRATVQWVPAGH